MAALWAALLAARPRLSISRIRRRFQLCRTIPVRRVLGLIRTWAPQLIIVRFSLLGALLLLWLLRRRLWQFRGIAMHRLMVVPVRLGRPAARLQERVQEASHDVKLATGHLVVTVHVAMGRGTGAVVWSAEG